MKGEDLAGLLVHSEPEPVGVRFLLHEAPQFVCLYLQTPEQRLAGGRHGLYVQMLRHCSKAGDHEVHEPPNADPHGATDAMQGNCLAEQAFHHRTLFCGNHSMGDVQNKLAATIFALMVLLASVDMAIFLEHLGSTPRTRVPHIRAHGHL
jgi:hypothetical protein